jgi:hypothetical protein
MGLSRTVLCFTISFALSLPVIAAKGDSSPALDVTIKYLNEMLDDARFMRGENVAKISRPQHSCGVLRFDFNGGYVQSRGEYHGDNWGNMALKPTAVTIAPSSDSESYNGLLLTCSHPRCIAWSSATSGTQGRREDNGAISKMLVYLSGENLPRYLKAFKHLQDLCGGTEKNPFD